MIEEVDDFDLELLRRDLQAQCDEQLRPHLRALERSERRSALFGVALVVILVANATLTVYRFLHPPLCP